MHAQPPVMHRAPARWPFLLALAGALVAAAWHGGLDAFAERQTEQALLRALIAFAIARGLNAVISVVQGTEVAVQPAGIGVNFTPGEVLDPVNDLVEQFSTVMLFAAASLGLQRLLIGIGAWMPLAIGITLLGAGWVVASWWQQRHARLEPSPALRALRMGFFLLIALRFAVPIAAMASEGAYRAFLADEYEQSRAELQQAGSRLGELADAIAEERAPADPSLAERARELFERYTPGLNIERRIRALEQLATAVTRNVVDLIAIFVVQTVIFPLLFLWLLWRGVARALPQLLRVS